jgi:hypothetical protein
MRKRSTLDIFKFNSILSVKAALVGKIVAERFNENEELVTRLSDESQNLK